MIGHNSFRLLLKGTLDDRVRRGLEYPVGNGCLLYTSVSSLAGGAEEQTYPATITGVSGMDAQMELTMTKAYDLTAVIRAKEGKDSYQMTAYFIAVTKPAGDGMKTEISWQFDRFAAGK